MPNGEKYSEPDLKAATIEVNYEVNQLVDSALRLSPRNPNNDGSQASALEVFLLHYRNIRDFLSEDPQQDDMAASHFCSSWVKSQWPDHVEHSRRNERNSAYTEKKLIDKCLSHLTHHRVTIRRELQTTTTWPVSKMCVTVKRELWRFTEQLPPDKRKWFADAKAALEKLQSRLVAGEISGSTTTCTIGRVSLVSVSQIRKLLAVRED